MSLRFSTLVDLLGVTYVERESHSFLVMKLDTVIKLQSVSRLFAILSFLLRSSSNYKGVADGKPYSLDASQGTVIEKMQRDFEQVHFP